MEDFIPNDPTDAQYVMHDTIAFAAFLILRTWAHTYQNFTKENK